MLLWKSSSIFGVILTKFLKVTFKVWFHFLAALYDWLFQREIIENIKTGLSKSFQFFRTVQKTMETCTLFKEIFIATKEMPNFRNLSRMLNLKIYSNM